MVSRVSWHAALPSFFADAIRRNFNFFKSGKLLNHSFLSKRRDIYFYFQNTGPCRRLSGTFNVPHHRFAHGLRQKLCPDSQHPDEPAVSTGHQPAFYRFCFIHQRAGRALPAAAECQTAAHRALILGLIARGDNIVTTQSLYNIFNNETIEAFHKSN